MWKLLESWFQYLEKEFVLFVTATSLFVCNHDVKSTLELWKDVFAQVVFHVTPAVP